MRSVIDHYREINDSLKVSVKIDHNEVLELVVYDLIQKRNSPRNKDVKHFDKVLMYYLGDEDFQKYVIAGALIKEPQKKAPNNNYAVQQASTKFPTFETCKETVNNIFPLNEVEENVGCLFYQTIQKLGNFA